MSAIRLSISNTNTFTLWGACISPSIKKWYHRLVSALGNLGKRKNGASGHPERLKFRKIMFRDVPTSCFLEK